MKKMKVSYEDMHNWCIDFAQDQWIENDDETIHNPVPYDRIIAISKGGLLPGVILANYFDIPLSVVDYSSKNGKGTGPHEGDFPIACQGKNLLIVDDICDSGHTIKDVVEYYKHHNDVDAYTVYYKKNDVHLPFYSELVEEDVWVEFPFEHKDIID